MKLIIGGYSQGKLNYTLRKIGEKEYRIFDGTLPEYTKIDTAEINIIKSDTTNTISSLIRIQSGYFVIKSRMLSFGFSPRCMEVLMNV